MIYFPYFLDAEAVAQKKEITVAKQAVQVSLHWTAVKGITKYYFRLLFLHRIHTRSCRSMACRLLKNCYFCGADFCYFERY